MITCDDQRAAVLTGSIHGGNININDIVMVIPYKYQFRVGGIVDKVIDGVLQRVVSFPKRQGKKLEHKKMLQCNLFLAIKAK